MAQWRDQLTLASNRNYYFELHALLDKSEKMAMFCIQCYVVSCLFNSNIEHEVWMQDGCKYLTVSVITVEYLVVFPKDGEGVIHVV